MKISFNPSNSNKNILDLIKNNKDIIFDLKGHSIFARGVEFKGTDTNTWRDIKINNVSIGSHTLDLRNGSNTTLTNTNGVVTINSTWRPVVDNLTSDSTTSSLSAKQGKVLKALIDGKSNSDHNHDGRYVRYYAVTTLDCNNLAAGLTSARISATNAAHTNHSAYLYISDVGTPFQIQIPDSSIPYIYKRYYGSGKWSGWFKLNAGYADSAGSVAWANVTGKPSSYTPSAHTHAWNSLTHSSTTENQAILTNGKANGWKLQTLNIARWDNAANNAHSHANKSVLDGITSALVNSWNTAYNFVSNITGTDTDKVINKWEEIVNFLAGITEDNKLNTLLNSKLSIQQLPAKDILTTKTNNALFWVDTKGNASTITTGPFTDHPYALLSVTNYNQNAENHKFFYRSRLAFSSAGDIKVASCHHEYEYQQDETWYNVLTSKNSGINGSTIKLNGTSITVYSSGTADGRYVKKSGDTMQGVLTIDTTNFGALTIKRNDDANGASIQFRGKSSVYGYIGLNNSTKDKQFLRWSSDTSRIYTILDTSSTYISNGKGVINGTTITQVDNATNSTNSTNARKLVNWYSARPTSLNAQFGDGSLRIFYATSSTTEGKPAEDSHILHLAWDNTGGYDAQLAVHTRSGKVSTRAQNGGTWQPWKTLAFTTDIPSSLKNPYSFNVFGVVYDGSAAKTVTTSTFISQVTEGTSTITDGTMLITSYASNSGFADTNAVNVPYKRKAIHLWEYIKAKTDSLYATKVHNHDGIYVRAFRTSNDNIDSDWGQSFKTFDPIPLGTPPEKNPNISLLSIGENFNRRKQLAFIWNNDNIYYRRRIDSGFTNWRRLAFANEIPTSLKNPYALTISLNGTSQGPYDGSAAKNINITPGSIGAAVSNHSHDYLVVNSADDKSFNSAYHNFQVLYAGGGNGITGKPANVDAFGLFKFRAANGCSGQMLLANGGSLYIRSSEDAKMTNTLAWKTILDSSNYSGILDSRYYTESEVNSLLSRKLDRVNLTTGSWNPRGYHLAADYHYNGGDLSISESGGKIHVSVDGYFWQNEGQYRVLDTSDVAGLKSNLTVHQYLSATDAAWYPLVWGGNSHNNTSDSTGAVYKSYDKLSWQTSSQTLYTTHLQTTDITFPNSGTSMRGIQGTVGDNDAWRIKGGATASNSGYLEIATADDGNEPIYVRQYTGTFSTIKRTLTLLDTNGFAHFPSYINIGGNENNNSSPDRVWGSNSSDSYLRSYRTSALRVAYAVNANSATTASSANKLTTARNIALGMDLRGSANFDGSGNITINANINACTIGVGSTNGLPFKRIAHFETGGSWNDSALLLYISQGYTNGSNGICRVEFRTNNISSSSTSITASAAVRWLVRNGYGLDSLYAGYYVTAGKAYIDIYLKTTSGYQGTVIRVLQDSRGGINSNVQLINSYYYSDTNHKEAYNSIEAASTALYNRAYTRIVSGSDIGTVSYSNSTGSVHWNNVTNKPSTFNPAAHTHTVFKNNLMIKGTNGISDSASIHLGIGDSDTGFKWISDGVCQIYANNVAVGQWTSGGMNWFKNPTVNGNKVWNAGNDGSGSGLDADTLDGEHASNFSYTHQTSFDFSKGKSGRIVTFDQSNTDYGWINGFASTHNNYLTSVIFNTHRTSNWYVGYIEAHSGIANGLLAVKQLAFLDSKVADSDKLDGVHLNGIFTGFSYAQSRLTATIGTVSKTVNVTGSYPSIEGVTMNTIASYGNCMGMANLASSNSNVNPNNQTSWHHFINMSYNTESTNMWQTQFAIKAGTTEVWVRSRAGGSISDSSAWAAPWVRLARITDNIASATNADMVDGYHANGLLTALSNSNNGISITVGGTTKSISNINVNYAASAGNANTLDGIDSTRFLRQVVVPNNTENDFNTFSNMTLTGRVDPTTGASLKNAPWSGSGPAGGYGVLTYLFNGSGYGTQMAWGYSDNRIYIRNRYWGGSGVGPVWRTSWDTLALTSDIPTVTNYYWANVKISASSSTTTSPTVHTLTATRVCAGHNPGIDNSISCSNWFRSSGNTGWYNTTYQGGWYMSDTSWIRAHNGVGIYTSGQIYSSSSIRMSNILLEHTDEINNSANGGIHLNYRNSGNVSLCYGGGNVGIGTTTPSYKLDVNGQMRASGFHHSSVNSDNYILLAGGGYKSFGGDDSTPIFLGCLYLYRGDDGTISSSFYCLGYSVPFTYTRGGNYCKIVIPDTTRLSFYIIAATASVNYSGGGMDTWTGYHRGSGAWWLHCYAFGWNEVRVKGFCQADKNNDSWWGGNPLWNNEYGANRITVCIFGHVRYK